MRGPRIGAPSRRGLSGLPAVGDYTTGGSIAATHKTKDRLAKPPRKRTGNDTRSAIRRLIKVTASLHSEIAAMRKEMRIRDKLEWQFKPKKS